MSPAPGRPFSIGKFGAGAWMIVSQARQESFGRICLMTFSRAGILSRTSVTSSPSLEKWVPPQPGHTSPAGWMISSRGRCSGNGLRTGWRRSGLGRLTLEFWAALAAPSLSSRSSSRSSSWWIWASSISEDWPNFIRRSLCNCALYCSMRR